MESEFGKWSIGRPASSLHKEDLSTFQRSYNIPLAPLGMAYMETTYQSIGGDEIWWHFGLILDAGFNCGSQISVKVYQEGAHKNVDT